MTTEQINEEFFINIKNSQGFQQILLETFIRKFKEQYGDTAFKVCTTTGEDYKAANKSMYSYYMKIINSFSILYSHWEYGIQETPDEDVKVIRERIRMIEDCRKAEDIILWAFRNIPLR